MKNFKIRYFSVDSNLGYLIQQITKDSTQEILGYFYGITQFVLDDLLKKSKASFLEKNIILYYKETPITFRIQIVGSGPARETPAVSITVSFPKNTEIHQVADLMNAVVESGLGLTEETNMALFDRPTLKTPRCLRDIRIKQDDSRIQTDS